MYYNNYPGVSPWQSPEVLHQPAKAIKDCCPQKPGSVLRISIPAGAVINLLNLIEVSSPSGICLVVRVPILGGSGPDMSNLFDSIKQAGGTVELLR